MINAIPLEFTGGGLDGLFLIFGLIMFGPAILFLIIGAILYNKKKKIAKILFILAGVYLLISLGVCGVMLSGF